MKKRLVIFVAMGVVLFSCKSTSEDYSIAATELCKCMEESGDLDKYDPLLNVNLGVCLLEAKVDLKDEQMADALEKQCPDISRAFKRYVKKI